MKILNIIFVVWIGCLVITSTAYAETCTYREALHAFDTGNFVRGQTLMEMAAFDGDYRAAEYLSRIAQINRINKKTPDSVIKSAIFALNTHYLKNPK